MAALERRTPGGGKKTYSRKAAFIPPTFPTSGSRDDSNVVIMVMLLLSARARWSISISSSSMIMPQLAGVSTGEHLTKKHALPARQCCWHMLCTVASSPSPPPTLQTSSPSVLKPPVSLPRMPCGWVYCSTLVLEASGSPFLQCIDLIY